MRRLTAGLAAFGMLWALAGCADPAREPARPAGVRAAIVVAAPDGVAFLGYAGIEDLGVVMLTERTFHEGTESSGTPAGVPAMHYAS